MSRRAFLTKGLAGVATGGIAASLGPTSAGSGSKEAKKAIVSRTLGRTGVSLEPKGMTAITSRAVLVSWASLSC